MRAVQFDVYGAALTVVDVPSPQCSADAAVVEVRATGLCRSDWHAWRGHEEVALPHVPGHEFAGVIVAIGPQVRRWSVGDRVTAPFVLGCGACEYCRAGDAQVCPDQRQPGFTGPGSFAERVAVERADFNLVALPPQLGFEAAASLGCRFATAFRAVTAHGRVAAGEWVVVFGCGGLGLAAVMIAAGLGARVVAVDVSGVALARATALGAVVTVDSTVQTEPAAAVRAATGGGAHVSLDAFGSAAAMSAAVGSLRRRGRHVQVGLLHGSDAMPAVPMARVIAEELEIHGSHGMAARDYPAMLELVATGGRLRPERLIGALIDLDGVPAAMAAMGSRDTDGITVIVP